MTTTPLSTNIKNLRQDVLELSQAQLAALLGMGVASINRIENGAQPTPAHQLLIEGLCDPSMLIRALDGKDELLGAATMTRLKKIARRLSGESELKKVAQYQELQWSESTSGRLKFDLNKLIEMVKFFTANGEWKTKLNKLLFYSDFIAHRDLGASISGTRYVVGSYGPIPDKQERLYNALTEGGILDPREEFASNGQPIEKFFSRDPLDRRKFNSAELKVLHSIRIFFEAMSAKQIADYSHAETFYTEGELGEAIPYSKSSSLIKITSSLNETEPSPSFGEIAAQISAQVPLSEWQKLPADGGLNIDKYLYEGSK